MPSKPQIEAKNLMILEDQMNHEALAAKKSETYAGYFSDSKLKQSADQLSQHHRENFNNLLNYLETHE
jgi:ferritin